MDVLIPAILIIALLLVVATTLGLLAYDLSTSLYTEVVRIRRWNR